jgi:hypothetical protein
MDSWAYENLIQIYPSLFIPTLLSLIRASMHMFPFRFLSKLYIQDYTGLNVVHTLVN